ncbi:MAG: ATP-binding protein, partial [Oscillospiraceae bacterium]
MNPCPCGYFGHPTRACTCNQSSIDRYLQRISGPLLDRIDLHVEVLPVDYEDIASEESGECSADIAIRVAAARAVQLKRFAGTNVACNAQIPSAMLRRICRLSKDANKLLKLAFERMGLSARAYDRVLKVSRTIADLDGSDIIDTQHVSEAVQYRNMDRKYWYTR